MSYSEPGISPPPGQPPYAAGQPFPGQAVYPGQPVHPVHPVYPGPPPLTNVLRSPQGLSTALTWLFCVAAVVGLFSAGANLYSWSLRQDLVAGAAGEDLGLQQAVTLTGASRALLTLTMAGTAVVFITWFHRVRVNGGIFRPDCFTQAGGWAIGWWFIPLANLFMPYWIARQIWTASTQLGPDGSHRHVSAAPITAWWLPWIATLIAERVASRMHKYAETVEAARDATAASGITSLLFAASAVLAALFVRKLTALQNVKAAQGPYAAA